MGYGGERLGSLAGRPDCNYSDRVNGLPSSTGPNTSATVSGRFRVYQRGLHYRPDDRIVYLDEIEAFVCRRPNLIRFWERWGKRRRVATGPDEIEISDARGAMLVRSIRSRTELKLVHGQTGGELLRIVRGRDGQESITRGNITEPFGWHSRGGGLLFRKPVETELRLTWLVIQASECRYGFRFTITPSERLLEGVALLYLTC